MLRYTFEKRQTSLVCDSNTHVYPPQKKKKHTQTLMHLRLLRSNGKTKHISILNRDLVEKMPSSHTYLLLGDAYMNIQEVGIK